MLYKRIDSSKNTTTNPQWIDYVYQVMLTYNNKSVHSSTKKIPADAMKDTHQVDVKANLELRAMKNRRCPPLNVNDNVKIMRKKKQGEKERTSKWSVEVFTVTSINEELGQNYYRVAGMDREYTRAEILKV